MSLQIEIPADLEAALNVDAAKAGVSPAEHAGKLLADRLTANGATTPNPDGNANRAEISAPNRDSAVAGGQPHISERIRQIFADVPEDAWDELPVDWPDNLDHYIHGTPQKKQ